MLLLTINEPILVYCMHTCVLSHFSPVPSLVTPWTVAHQAHLSMGFSRQEYRSGLRCPSPGDLPDPGIKPTSLYVSCRQVLYPLSHQGNSWYLINQSPYFIPLGLSLGFPVGSAGKESACNVGDLGSIPGSGRPPGEGKGYPLQYSGLENPMDRGVWEAKV